MEKKTKLKEWEEKKEETIRKKENTRNQNYCLFMSSVKEILQ